MIKQLRALRRDIVDTFRDYEKLQLKREDLEVIRAPLNGRTLLKVGRLFFDYIRDDNKLNPDRNPDSHWSAGKLAMILHDAGVIRLVKFVNMSGEVDLRYIPQGFTSKARVDELVAAFLAREENK